MAKVISHRKKLSLYPLKLSIACNGCSMIRGTIRADSVFSSINYFDFRYLLQVMHMIPLAISML